MQAQTIILWIVAVVVVVGGALLLVQQNASDEMTADEITNEKTLEDGTIVKDDGTMVKPDGTMVKPDGTMIKPDGTMEEKDLSAQSGEGAMMKKEDGAMMAKYTGAVLAGTSAPLLDFKKADYDAAVKSNKVVVLYFYANWCPICKVEFPEVQGAFNTLTTDEVVGFRVNYKDSDTDTDETNLAREFGVPYQHTKVFLKNGKQILKAPDSWDKMRYLEEIGKAIRE